MHLPLPLLTYLAVHGRPIRYGYVRGSWPISMYQNVYANEPGSAEMPSAGRPFTPEVITRLVAKGVSVAPLVLHTGVSSLESHEAPYAEYYRVDPHTAHLVNDTHRQGGRVIAIGTTVVRALETVADERGHVHPGEGWTETVITPDRGVRAVDGLLTGWHEPEASHLDMLEAIAGRRPRRAVVRRRPRRGLPLARVRRRPPDPPLTPLRMLGANCVAIAPVFDPGVREVRGSVGFGGAVVAERLVAVLQRLGQSLGPHACR